MASDPVGDPGGTATLSLELNDDATLRSESSNELIVAIADDADGCSHVDADDGDALNGRSVDIDNDDIIND
jgi:hypothetical protein